MKPWKKTLSVVLALFLATGIGAVVLLNGPLAGIKVVLTHTEQDDLAPKVFGIGTVEARRSYLIGPTVASRVVSVLADHGDAVKAGQLLVELDPVDLDERMVSAANAMKRAASAVDVAAAQLSEAKSREQLAAASAARFRELRQKNFVSKEAEDGKQHEANAARAALAANEAALSAARRDYDRLGADRAGIGKQRAQYRLLSPIDGLVSARDAEPGSTVIAGQSVMRLIDPASLWIKARVDQGRAQGIALDAPAEIVLRSRPGKPLPGKVARIEVNSDSVAEERIVDIAFDNPPLDLSVGELTEVTIQLPPVTAALSLPAAAIRHGQQRPGVWRNIDGKATFVPVRIGAQTLEGRIQVLDGLARGDEVVLHSTTELRGGERLRAVENLSR
ncbi:MAG: efflux RND transporter periplasmic adaptor subunit [Rhodocyclaceae bacterium]|nr:efflux RND transporter periplasmic adaptor subunit [Rhodocyclaceae bacterium]